MKKLLTNAFLVTIIVLSYLPQIAEARVDIVPRRVVIEPRDRSGEVTILNIFDKPGLYRISTLHYHQNEDGTYEKLDAPNSEFFNPDEHVRISPKQFEVSPGGRQKIRISVRKPDALPDGEYRFHLVATRYDTLSQEEAEKNNPSGNVTVSMKMNLGVSIPIVIRHGDVNVETEIKDISYNPQGQAKSVNSVAGELQMTVTRDGNIGTLGSIRAYLNGDRIGALSNLNVFTDVEKRIIHIPLKVDPRGKGKINIVYSDDDGNIFNETTAQF